jgi:hypothetical protein
MAPSRAGSRPCRAGRSPPAGAARRCESRASGGRKSV